MSAVTADDVEDEIVLSYIRMASCNQIFDPWIYILCQVPQLRRVKSKTNLQKVCNNNIASPS